MMHFRICPLMWPSRALPGKTIASCSVWPRRKWDICGWVLTQVRSREFSLEVLWFTHNQEIKVWFRQHWESFPVPPALIDWTLKTDCRDLFMFRASSTAPDERVTPAPLPASPVTASVWEPTPWSSSTLSATSASKWSPPAAILR